MGKISLSNAALKNVAYVSMVIDHFFAVLFWVLVGAGFLSGLTLEQKYGIYRAGRAIGRSAFVVFAYFIVEGFLHTKSRKNYLARMAVFALLSEIPFDLAFNGAWYSFHSQNIFFTLCLGIAALMLIEHFRGRPLLQGAGVLLCCFLAGIFRTDYMFMGVMLIVALYWFRQDFTMQAAAGIFVMYVGTVGDRMVSYAGSGLPFRDYFVLALSEMYGAFAFVLLYFYNGKRGRHLPKFAGYFFYPAHLLVLCAVRYLIQ